jgi:hypothetical protein
MREGGSRRRLHPHPQSVIPAKAGIHFRFVTRTAKAKWIPAFAGMTDMGSLPLIELGAAQ